MHTFCTKQNSVVSSESWATNGPQLLVTALFLILAPVLVLAPHLFLVLSQTIGALVLVLLVALFWALAAVQPQIQAPVLVLAPPLILVPSLALAPFLVQVLRASALALLLHHLHPAGSCSSTSDYYRRRHRRRRHRGRHWV